MFAICLGLGAVLAGPVVAKDVPSGGAADVAAAEESAEETSTESSEKAPVVPVDPGPGVVWVVTLDDEIINRGTRDYYIEAMEKAAADPSVRALVLVLDTPGGSLQSTREIVKAMLISEIPLIIYVSPKGSRAASAGTFITMAAHVAAMAPATNIGAAHPVMMAAPGMGGEDEDAEKKRDSEAAMLEKVTNDSVAFIRNVAEQRGRNPDWAEQAVRDSVSIQATEAVELNVVDLEAASLDELLKAIDGREIKISEERSVVLRTSGQVEHIEMTTAQRVLTMLTHPNVTYLLMALAALGFYLEFNNPGMIVPGVVGAIALLLAAFGLSAIPVNLLALVFVLIGFGCLFAEVYFPSYGLLTVGGAVSLAFGGLFLVKKSPEFNVGVSPEVVLFVVVLSLLCVGLVAWLVWRGHKRQVMGGSEGMVGAQGKVTVAIPGGYDLGRVFVHSEIWQARAPRAIAVGSRVRVVGIDGMEVQVEALEERREQPREPSAAEAAAPAEPTEE
jgi:membrane-bound serine protease (ClpP class)